MLAVHSVGYYSRAMRRKTIRAAGGSESRARNFKRNGGRGWQVGGKEIFIKALETRSISVSTRLWELFHRKREV